jgi:hypothetical protein
MWGRTDLRKVNKTVYMNIDIKYEQNLIRCLLHLPHIMHNRSAGAPLPNKLLFLPSKDALFPPLAETWRLVLYSTSPTMETYEIHLAAQC